jgi:hypothetical protein
MADTFLVIWLSFVAGVWGLFFVIMNFDRVAVFLLSEIDAPFYGTARTVAAMLRERPNEWTPYGSYTLKHPLLDVSASCVRGVSVSGPFGEWKPDFIERRLIWDAMVWYRREYIRSLVRRQITITTIEHRNG